MGTDVVLKQSFDGGKVVFSYLLACLGSLTCVLLMDQRRQLKSPRMQRAYLAGAAVALGACGIWSMHQMGMSALTLTVDGHVLPIGYDPTQCVVSLFAAILCVYGGLEVASTDAFFGKDNQARMQILKTKLVADKGGLKDLMTRGKWLAEYKALYSDLSRLVAGGVLAAAGVGVMHYVGMSSMQMDADRHWRPGVVVAAMIIAVTAGSAAFWILFRVLEWKPDANWLRGASTLIMGAAVCGMHYTGMYSRYYTYNPNKTAKNFNDNGTTILMAAVTLDVLYSVGCLYWIIITGNNEYRRMKRALNKLKKMFRGTARGAVERDNSLGMNTTGGLGNTSSNHQQFLQAMIAFMEEYAPGVTDSNGHRTASQDNTVASERAAMGSTVGMMGGLFSSPSHRASTGGMGGSASPSRRILVDPLTNSQRLSQERVVGAASLQQLAVQQSVRAMEEGTKPFLEPPRVFTLETGEKLSSGPGSRQGSVSSSASTSTSRQGSVSSSSGMNVFEMAKGSGPQVDKSTSADAPMQSITTLLGGSLRNTSGRVYVAIEDEKTTSPENAAKEVPSPRVPSPRPPCPGLPPAEGASNVKASTPRSTVQEATAADVKPEAVASLIASIREVQVEPTPEKAPSAPASAPESGPSLV